MIQIYKRILQLEAKFPDAYDDWCFRNEGGYNWFDLKLMEDVIKGCNLRKANLDHKLWQNEVIVQRFAMSKLFSF